MDMQDFRHNWKYKTILPIIYIINWILMLTGPIFYPMQYQIYALTFFTYMTIKTIFNFGWCLIGFKNGIKSLRRYREAKRKELKGVHNSNNSEVKTNNQVLLNDNDDNRIYHGFIIPSYKEDLTLLEETLMKLSQHKNAKNRYLVYLAMQEHQQGSIQKAETLIRMYENSFKQMGYSHHKIRQFQQKGKASNVSWCVQNLQKTYFKSLDIRVQDIFLTIIDADSWVPQMYINQVDDHINNTQDSKYSYIYQPCQIFTRNHMQVPFLTRTYDQSHSLVHFCNLVTCFDASFPLSNYSLSYSMIKNIGFWDTCPDAIGQDFHTTIKSFWKTQGLIKTIYLHTPFNQVNIQTGQGYWNDINARFWQAERHARGCADVAYCLNQIIKNKINWRTFIISYNSIQCFVMPAILPWLMLGSVVHNFVNMYPMADWYSDILFKICTYSFIGSYVLYFILKRKVTEEIYHLKNQSIWRIIQFPLMIIPNLFLVSFPTFTIAAFKVMLNRNQYQVAKKKLTTK